MDRIKELKALDDAAFMEATGLADQLAKLRSQIEEADKLTGKDRKRILDRLDERLNPKLDAHDLRWMLEDATNETSPCGLCD